MKEGINATGISEPDPVAGYCKFVLNEKSVKHKG